MSTKKVNWNCDNDEQICKHLMECINIFMNNSVSIKRINNSTKLYQVFLELACVGLDIKCNKCNKWISINCNKRVSDHINTIHTSQGDIGLIDKNYISLNKDNNIDDIAIVMAICDCKIGSIKDSTLGHAIGIQNGVIYEMEETPCIHITNIVDGLKNNEFSIGVYSDEGQIFDLILHCKACHRITDYKLIIRSQRK